MRQNRFKKRSQFQIFKLSNFTLTWSNDGKVCSVWADKAYSKELQQKSVELTYWWNEAFMQLQCGPLFPDFCGNRLREKEQICGRVLTASKGCSDDNDLIRITWNRKKHDSLKLPNLLNALSISTSGEGKSWERQQFFCYSLEVFCSLKPNIYIYYTS